MASDKNKPVEPTEWANAAKTIPNFDATRYERGANPRTWYADGSDAYAERGMVISFHMGAPILCICSRTLQERLLFHFKCPPQQKAKLSKISEEYRN